MVLSLLLVILGFVLLVNGADLLVDGSSNLAKKLHIPQIIIGLTIVSIGTSTPELFVSVTSIVNGYEDISLGNIIGSNICNLLLILGLSSIVNPLKIKKQTRKIEIPINFIATILLIIFCNYSDHITRNDGIILVGIFILFLLYTILITLKKANIARLEYKNNNEASKTKVIPNILLILFSIYILKLGADIVVSNSINIAHIFNISEKVIGLTVVAIGTSLPELVTSVTAAFKKNSDIAVGNIIGSNIFNILGILGLTCTIRPVVLTTSYNKQLIILLVASILIHVFPNLNKNKEMTRKDGIIYLIIYFIYLYILIQI